MPLARQMHARRGLEASLMGDSRQSAPKSLREPAGKGSGWLVLALVFTLLQGVCFFLSWFTRNQKTKPPQLETVKFHSSRMLTVHGATGLFILWSSRQREREGKKEAGITPTTTISGPFLCNYPCMERHTKEEENMVLSLQKLALLLGGRAWGTGMSRGRATK